MTGNIAIFWPMILQAALTLAVYPVLMMRRTAAARAGARPGELYNGVEAGGPSFTATRNLANQYELPVLFYVVCLALFATNGASWLAVVLAWIFALSRLVHAGVHLGPNTIPLRGAAFGVGYLVVIVLWVLFALHLADIGAVLAGS